MDRQYKELGLEETATNAQLHEAYKKKLGELPPEFMADEEAVKERESLRLAYEGICRVRDIEASTGDEGKAHMLTEMPTVQLRKKRGRASLSERMFPNHEAGTLAGHSYGICWIQGKRDTMEDEHLAKPLSTGDDDLGCFAIFDGHGGKKTATACANGLVPQISVELESFKQQPITPRQLACAAFTSICKLDTKLRDDLGDEREASGATAVTCLTTPTHIVFANLGDSRGVLARSGGPPFQTQDHKPGVPAEIARIEAAGGMVKNGRVNTFLGVSRALGDFDYKNPKKPQDEMVVTPCSDVYVIPKSGCDFIVLACDGVWDVLSSVDVIDLVRKGLATGKSAEEVAVDLGNAAIAAKSDDNISVMLILLKPAADIGSTLSKQEETYGLVDSPSARVDEETRKSCTTEARLQVLKDRVQKIRERTNALK